VATGVAELVQQLRRGVQRIGVDHDQARAQRPEHRDRILQRVGQHDGEAITFPEPLLLQPCGEGTREHVELPVGELGTHLDEGDALAVLGTGFLQQLLQRAQLRGVDFRGHVGRIRLQPRFCPSTSPL